MAHEEQESDLPVQFSNTKANKIEFLKQNLICSSPLMPFTMASEGQEATLPAEVAEGP